MTLMSPSSQRISEPSTTKSYHTFQSEEQCLLLSAVKSREDSPPEQEKVHPWKYHGGHGHHGKSQKQMWTSKSVTTKTQYQTVMILPNTIGGAQKRTEQRTTCARTLKSSQSAGEMTRLHPHRGYGTHKTRRNSILRLDSRGRISSQKGMKKSASVEFVLDFEAEIKHVTKSKRAERCPSSRDRPRRLTDDEKAELYRQRPDLEIGPVPYYEERMAEIHRENARRVVIAMFSGAASIVVLMVLYNYIADPI